jgi:hypothetical protein
MINPFDCSLLKNSKYTIKRLYALIFYCMPSNFCIRALTLNIVLFLQWHISDLKVKEWAVYLTGKIRPFSMCLSFVYLHVHTVHDTSTIVFNLLLSNNIHNSNWWNLPCSDDRLEAWPDMSQGYPPIRRSVDKDGNFTLFRPLDILFLKHFA